MKKLTLILLLAACGGAQTTSTDDIPGHTDPATSIDCPYSLEDSCIDEGALAACQDASAECPGNVQVMESCPLQFSCGGQVAAEAPDTNDGEACTDGETRPDDCNTCTCEGGIWSCTEMGCS